MLNQTSEQEIIQNLQDAGCDKDTIAAFVLDMQNGELKVGRRRLEQHRRSLLDELHTVQKRIDCLDYLLYRLNQQIG